MTELYYSETIQNNRANLHFIKINPFLSHHIKPAEFWFGYLTDINAYYPLWVEPGLTYKCKEDLLPDPSKPLSR